MNDPELPVPFIPSDISAQIKEALEHARCTPMPELRADPAFCQTLNELGRRISEAMQPVIRAFQRVGKQIAEAVKFFLTSHTLPVRRRPRRRNTRVQMVQAKRKRLYLTPDGKCCTLRSRKASYAFRLEEQRYHAGQRADLPRLGDFEHVPARRRKKESRRLRMYTWIQTSEECPLCAGGFIDSRTLFGGRDSGPELVWPAPGAQIFPRSRQEEQREYQGEWY